MMKKIALALAIISFLTPAFADKTTEATTNQASVEAFKMMDAVQVKAALDKKAALAVFDANSEETFAKHHVPGATWVAYDQVDAKLLPADKSKAVVFYCANEQCMASHIAAKQVAELGYSDVNVMPQGIQGWVKAGYPVDQVAKAD